jgi:hypothetical protein
MASRPKKEIWNEAIGLSPKLAGATCGKIERQGGAQRPCLGKGPSGEGTA